jgi:tripartite-type tricarboxylate transporter receptor subunit TctC
LWVFANKRYSELPDVPTHIELGMSKEWANFNLIRLIAMPPNVPPDIQRAFTEALIKTLQDKRTLEWSKKAEIPVDIVEKKELDERIRIVQEGFKNNIEIVRRYFF